MTLSRSGLELDRTNEHRFRRLRAMLITIIILLLGLIGEVSVLIAHH